MKVQTNVRAGEDDGNTVDPFDTTLYSRIHIPVG